jgi:DNA-binding NarL/FixJ family response regulator
MPAMNGLDAARTLRRVMPRIPIIMFSDYADVLPETDAQHAGISAVLSKTEHMSVLVSTARGLLNQIAA